MRATILFSLVVLFSASLGAAEEWPDVTVEGLHRLEESRLAVVYADPSADLSQYKRINILDAAVAFRKNWERDQRRQSGRSIGVTSSDIERIKSGLAELFREEFSAALEENGYQVTEEIAEDVLLLRPAIINLDVTAPDTMSSGRSRSYTQSAGEMTLYIEMYDSVTSDLLVKALDRQGDGNSQFYTWSNSVTNRAAAKRIVKGWAGILVNALNEARGNPAIE